VTKKDFALIARVVGTLSDPETRWTMADLFAKVLKAEHPSFNVVMFMKACRVTPRSNS